MASLASCGLSVVFVCGDNQREDKIISEGKCQLIFVSPESIMTNLRWREVLRSDVYQRHLVVLAVDEANCVPKWQKRLPAIFNGDIHNQAWYAVIILLLFWPLFR